MEKLKSRLMAAMGAASLCWTNPNGAGTFKAEDCTKIGLEFWKELETTRAVVDALLQRANDIICNAGEGNWQQETEEWRTAAEEFRGQYQEYLGGRYGEQ